MAFPLCGGNVRSQGEPALPTNTPEEPFFYEVKKFSLCNFHAIKTCKQVKFFSKASKKGRPYGLPFQVLRAHSSISLLCL